MFLHSGECGWLHETNDGIGVCLNIGETNFAFPERCTCPNATSAEFLEVQIPPPVLVMAGICRCPVSSTRSAQKFVGKNKKKTLLFILPTKFFISLYRYTFSYDFKKVKTG